MKWLLFYVEKKEVVVSLATTKETQPTKLTAAQLKKKLKHRKKKSSLLKMGLGVICVIHIKHGINFI